MKNSKGSLLVIVFLGVLVILFSSRNSVVKSNSTKFSKRDKTIGDFNGDGKMESILRKQTYDDPFCFSKLYFSDKKIEPLIDTGIFVSTTLNEGNLDKKSGDEFTVYFGSCEAGEWLGGVLYSVRDNKCVRLANFSVYRNVATTDFVYPDPADPKAIIIEEDYWKGDSLAVRKKRLVIQ